MLRIRARGAPAAPPPMRWLGEPGTIINMLLPMPEMVLPMYAVAPCPSDSMVSTAATPITTPSTVSSERRRLRKSAENATEVVERRLMRAPMR